jgi:hypothetical protein
MSEEAFGVAAQAAFDLILQYGQDQPRFSRRPTMRDMGDPDQLIRQALAESQRLLVTAAQRALLKKIGFLKATRNWQLSINCLHLVTGSAFIMLIAGIYPNAIKWVGAVFALVAGIISLLLPRNLAALERGVFTEVSDVASLIGRVGRIQVELLTMPASKNAALAREAADVIGRCLELAKKYELEKHASSPALFSKSQSPNNVNHD